MAIVTEITRDTALFAAREPTSRVWYYMRSTQTLDDTAYPATHRFLREAALLNDDYVQLGYSLMRDVALLSDTALGGTVIDSDLRDAGQLNDLATPTTITPLTNSEVAELNDTITSSSYSVLRDTAALGETLTVAMTVGMAVREVATVGDRSIAPIGLDIREQAQLNDSYASTLRAVQLVREEAVSLGYDTMTARLSAVVRDVFMGGSMVSSQLAGSAVIRDVFWADGWASPPPYGRAYSTNIVNWAMSTYSNYAFRSRTSKYGAGNNLWALEGTKDHDTPVVWKVVGGEDTFGIEQFKTPSDVFLYGKASAEITVKVTGDVRGQRQTFEYPTEVRDMSDSRVTRAKVGKGFRSSFLQIELGGEDMTAEIINAKLVASVGERRL